MKNAMINLDQDSFEFRDKMALEEIRKILDKYQVGMMPLIRTVDLKLPAGEIPKKSNSELLSGLDS